MRRMLWLLVLPVGCATGVAQHGAPPGTPLQLAGSIRNASIVEASGMAASVREPELLWVLNDGDSGPVLYAIDHTGRSRGRVTLDAAQNIDWEDMASFSVNGVSQLLIADIGDNNARRDYVSLYLVDEPDLHETSVRNLPVSARIDFRYPDGPQDAESIAVDVEGNRILVMSKRDIPTTLYELPLRATSGQHAGEVQIAKRLGRVASLPLPSEKDVKRAPLANDWHWQPTAMDISPDASAIAVLTYRAVYHFNTIHIVLRQSRKHTGIWRIKQIGGKKVSDVIPNLM